jgi:hypothetical protein
MVIGRGVQVPFAVLNPEPALIAVICREAVPLLVRVNACGDVLFT